MTNQIHGRPFRGEVSSSDASAGTTFTLYDANGASITLDTAERLVVTDIEISSDTAMRADVFFGANTTVDAGELLMGVYFGASGGASKNLNTPLYLPKGLSLRFKTSASGAVRAVASGVIVRT